MNCVFEVIEPQGILDGTKVISFREKINQSIDSGVKIILVDFTDITFMDSSGLGALVLALKTVHTADVKLALCSINEQVKMLFELTSMDQVFEIFSSREEFENSINSL